MRCHAFVLALAVLLAFAATIRAEITARTWSVDGEERTANVYTPDDAAKKPADGWPIVFVFHGHGNTAAGAQRQFEIGQHWPGAIVVYPQGLPTKSLRVDREGKKSGWDVSAAPKSNRDVKFYDAMLDQIIADGGDAHRVYVTGSSNGGVFAYYLWMYRPDTMQAVAPVSASAGEVKSLDLKPKPAMLVAGRKDKLVDFREQEGTIEFIKRLNGCTGDGEPWGGDTARRFNPEKGEITIVWKHAGGHAPPRHVGRAVTAFFKLIGRDRPEADAQPSPPAESP